MVRAEDPPTVVAYEWERLFSTTELAMQSKKPPEISFRKPDGAFKNIAEK
jgi:hypothetical protein